MPSNANLTKKVDTRFIIVVQELVMQAFILLYTRLLSNSRQEWDVSLAKTKPPSPPPVLLIPPPRKCLPGGWVVQRAIFSLDEHSPAAAGHVAALDNIS